MLHCSNIMHFEHVLGNTTQSDMKNNCVYEVGYLRGFLRKTIKTLAIKNCDPFDLPRSI